MLILRGGARAEKTQFFGQIFQKVPKNAFFDLFFQNFACGAQILAKIGIKQCFGRARKINLVDLKKRSTNFLKIRPPPLRENPRSAPAFYPFNILPLRITLVNLAYKKRSGFDNFFYPLRCSGGQKGIMVRKRTISAHWRAERS